MADCPLAVPVPIPSKQSASKKDQSSVLEGRIGKEKANTIK
jgi:hypothetical protein